MGVGPPITQSPHTSGCPRGDFGPHKSTHTSPSPTFIGDTCEPRGGGWAPPPACPTPPSLPGFSWVWGKGMWQPPGLLLSTHPPNPLPRVLLCSHSRDWGTWRRWGGGGGVHECPSAHNFVQQPLLPVSWGLSGSCPAAPAVLLGDKVGTITAGTESGPSMAGGMRTEPPPPPGAGMDKMLAALTGCSRQGDRLGPAACACLQLAVDGGGVVSLLGARKQGPPHPEPPTFCRGMVAAAPWLGTWWPWKVPFNVTSWHLPIHPRSQEPCPGGWGLWKGAAAPSSGDVRDMEGPSAWREGLKAGAWPQHEPNSASASLCNWPGTKFDPGPSASHTHASLGGFSFGSWRKMALAEHPHWRGR